MKPIAAKAAPKLKSNSIVCTVAGCGYAAKYVPRSFTVRVPTHCPEHAQPRDDFFEFNCRLCEVETCHRRASFAQPGDTKLRRCGDHKLAGDVNNGVKARRCPCGKVASFRTPDEEGARFCATCKPSEAVTINALCKMEGCRTQVAAVITGRENEGMQYCMVCVATLGVPYTNGRVPYCACGTQAIFDLPGTPRRRVQFCGSCMDPRVHVDLWHKMCNACGVVRPLRERGKDVCLRCHTFIYPDEPLSRNYRTKEVAVEKYLTEQLADRYTMIFNRRVVRVAAASAGAGGAPEEGCTSSGKKPDAFIDMGAWVVVVEVDEEQHKHTSYDASCENKRIMQIFDDAGRRPIVFVRFNPDKYVDSTGKKVASPWTVDKRTASGVLHVSSKNESKWMDRLNTLKRTIEHVTSVAPSKDVSYVYLYFDGYY